MTETAFELRESESEEDGEKFLDLQPLVLRELFGGDERAISDGFWKETKVETVCAER